MLLMLHHNKVPVLAAVYFDNMYINYVHSGMEGKFRIIYWAMLNVTQLQVLDSRADYFGFRILRCLQSEGFQKTGDQHWIGS
ncbi:hypothetical protein LINPERPRIM_LOCUS27568 [Linum perenne]